MEAHNQLTCASRRQSDTSVEAVTTKTMQKRMTTVTDNFKRLTADSSEGTVLDRCRVVGALGEGSFGIVVLLRDEETKVEYALKGMSKQHLKEEQQDDMVRNERNIMMLLDSEFVVRLHNTFEDPKYLYLLLEPAMGGELFDVYQDNDLFGKIDCARFYVACVSLGLAHMHDKRVIWRDLKLENLLLNSQGYLKLTDMGIAKMVVGRTYSVCGTADYFAPETLKQVGHNRAVDWWACGILLFIMLAGRSPFDAPEVSQIYKNIIKGMTRIEFPKSCTPEAEEVIRSLCKKKPEDRITMLRGGVNNLKEMVFFKDFDWNELQALTMVPPFLPPPANYDKIASKSLSKPLDVQWKDLHEWGDGANDVTWISEQSKTMGAVNEEVEDEDVVEVSEQR